MSGIEVTKEPKQGQDHACKSCMETVVQTFTHMQEHIAQLKQEKLKLQLDLEKSKKEQKQKEQTLKQKIKALEQTLAELENK